MIDKFNEKGHPMVFREETVNTDHLIEKCRAAIASLTHQHGMAERLAEACFMIALSELENNWKQRAEAAEAEVQRLNANAQPVSDGCKVPEGWKLVPIEPSWEMLSADGCKDHHNGQKCLHHDNRRRIWAAMLAAAPGGHDS